MADFPTSVPGPSYPIDKQASPRVRRVQFGDGYTQEAPDGINSLLYVWSLQWDVLTTSEKNTIESFLVARGGYETFNWTDPSGTTYKVKCAEWSVNNFEPSVWKISATFRQSPI